MSKAKIVNPKVFISYAWGTKEYQEKVLSLATDLVGDGIDVILDKWSLKEGNDTYAFMEQSANDPTVTNVLLLLDPQYEKKANDRDGGVGTETQIISSEIYNNVSQDKFLPVVFERDEEGDIPKPIYLKGIFHFDLTIEEKYDAEYQRLVRTLYGIETYKKPELGKKPAWLETEESITVKKRTAYDVLKTNTSERIRSAQFESFLGEICNKILDYGKDDKIDLSTPENYIESYMRMKPIRNEALSLFQYTPYIEACEKVIVTNLEKVQNELESQDGKGIRLCKSLLHELFIYIVAIFFKNRNYKALAYIFSKTYFVGRYSESAQSFRAFYYYNEQLHNAVCEYENERYLSGIAKFWVSNICTDVCSKNEFVFADILCYNASTYVENYVEKVWRWFPLTYIYDGYENRTFQGFAKRLCSREHYLSVAQLFGYEDAGVFTEKMAEVERLLRERVIENYRYNGAFECAPLISHYIKAEEVAKYK